MLFFPSLKLKAIIWIAQIFLLLTLLVEINLAGVIIKRDLSYIENTRLDQNETISKEQQILPTILSAVANERLKLQPAFSNFSSETSKELSFNEIALNEAKKLELKSSIQNLTSTGSREEVQIKTSTENLMAEFQNSQGNPNAFSNFTNNRNLEETDIKLDSSTDSLVEEKIDNNSPKPSEVIDVARAIITTTPFSSNVLEEEKEKMAKNKEKSENTKLLDGLRHLEMTTSESAKAEKDEENNLSSLENSLKSLEKKADSSKLLNGFNPLEITTTETAKDKKEEENNLSFLEKSLNPVEITTAKAEKEKENNLSYFEKSLNQVYITTAKSAKAEKEEENHLSSFENSLKALAEKPRPLSQIENEFSTLKPNNDIETSRDRTIIHTNENSMETTTTKEMPTELKTENKPMEEIKTADTINGTSLSENKTSRFESTLLTEEDIKITTFKPNLKVSIEDSTTLGSPETVTKIYEYINKSIEPTIEIMKNLTKLPNPTESYSREEHSNSINDGLDREELLKSSKLENIPETTTLTSKDFTNKEDSSDLMTNKMEYARSMSRESDDELKEIESSTLQFNNENEIEIITSPKSILNGIKENTEGNTKGNVNEKSKELAEITEEIGTKLEENKENFNESLKFNEKKAKFINDNSTNVQHLNLPNNAESWNLASMKPLFKGNVTIDTAHKQNISNEIKEFIPKNNTFSINNISEKNLLDWSKVMNEELYTTIRNQNIQQLEKEEEEEKTNGNRLTNEENIFSTTDKELEKEKHHEKSDMTTTSLPSLEIRDEMPKIKTFIEQETTTNSTITPNSNTILSNNFDNNKEKEEDKHANSMNNHIETFKETEKLQSQLNSNPFVNNEPNLSETNKQQNNENEQQNNTATGKQDVNVDTDTSSERATATEATAGVVDMMTTTLEQNSIEITTLSTLEASKQNASQSNVSVTQQQQQQNNNEILENSLQNELDKTVKQEVINNKFENIELLSKITTTSEIPITTYRPINLAITSTTPSFKQEIDQNGINEIRNSEQKQSITTTAFEGGNNSKIIEKHLSELEIETTTLETPITTATTTTENNTTITSEENNTSSSKGETINEQIIKLDVTTIQATTLKSKEDIQEEDITTIGSPVIETKFEKEEEILTTTAETSNETTITPKTPVVVVVDGIETQGALTHNESSTIETVLDEDKHKINETQINQGSDNNTEKIIEKSKEIQESENNNEQTTTTTMGTYTINTTTMKNEDETLKINLLDDTTTTITTTTVTQIPTTISTTTTATSTTTTPLPITTKIEEIYKVIYTTTTEVIPTTTTSQLITESEELFSSSTPLINMIPTTTTTDSTKMIETADIGKSLPTITSIRGGNSGNMYPKNSEVSGETDVNVIIAITVSVIGVVALILLVGFLYLMRKRQKQTSYSQRCRPVSLDEYTIDNASVGGSMRKSSALRSSKRTYGNLAFDDPSLRHNAMGVHELAKFAQEKLRIFEEFRDVPQITSRLDEVPIGCEDKNRYANVLPLPETRVILQRLNDDDKTEYINANYVTGPKDPPNYYIACQAPLDTTVEDFWRMIWEQQSRVIIQATDLIENGVEKCAEYLPPSVTLDNHSTFGDFQITLQNREIKDKYAISTILLKHVTENATRELTHYWYKWPEVGVPAEEAPIIAMLLEARSSLISYAIEQGNEDKEKSSTATLKSAEEGTVSANGTTTSPSKDSNSSSANGSNTEINGNISMVNIKKTARNQGPLTIHCSPGTGRTGTIIGCDIAIRSLETPKRTVDIPQIVYYVRRGRASAVLTKEQYEFIYKVANMYAAKISNPTTYN